MDPSHEESVNRITHRDGAPTVRILPFPLSFKEAKGL